MGFGLLCGTLIALIFAAAVCFWGYRLFLILLPIWGFFIGLFIGAEAIQVLFGIGFLGTVTSWVVGFVVGVIFAVLAYLFYIFAVAVVAGALGYALAAGLLYLIGIDGNLIVFLVGLAAGVALAFVTLRFNIPKYVIIVATALGGAAASVAILSMGVVEIGLLELRQNPVRAILDATSWLGVLLFLAMLIGGIVVQLRASRDWEVEPYENRI